MKTRWSKRFLSIILSFIIVCSASVLPLCQVAMAEDSNIYEIADYKGKNAQEAHPTKTGKVFAGWYEDSQCTEPLGEDVLSGKAYAKFVDANVLSVKGQLREGTDEGSENATVRLLTSVDNLQYASVGFKINVNGKSIICETNTVYETIYGYTGQNQNTYTPNVFSEESSFFAAITLEDIPQEVFADVISVTPMWTTPDGTTVTGLVRYFSINSALGNTVDVEEDGTVTLWNPTGSAQVRHTFTQSVAAGEEIRFDIEVLPTQTFAVWLLADRDGGREYYAAWHDAGTRSITVSGDRVKAGMSCFEIIIEFGNKDALTNCVAVISNVRKVPKTLSYGTVWSAPSTVLIDQNETSNAGTTAAALSYEMVRNEYENYQLLLTANKGKEVTSFELLTSDLKCGSYVLSKKYIDAYVQKYVTYSDTYASGTSPDALIPMEAAAKYGENKIQSGLNGGLWITVYAPKNTVAGEYTGTFELIVRGAAGNEAVDIPVEVIVKDYTLTDDVTAGTLFSWRYDRVAVGELDGSIDMMEYYYEFFQDYRISLEVLPLETLSGEEFATNVVKYYDTLSTYTILSQVGDVARHLENYPDKVKEQILAVAAACTEDRNLFDKAVMYMVDEPAFGSVAAHNDIIKRLTSVEGYLEDCIAIINANPQEYAGLMSHNDWADSIRNIPNVMPTKPEHIDWLLANQNTEEGQRILNAINCIAPMYSDFQGNGYQQLVDMCNKHDILLWWYSAGYGSNGSTSYNIGNQNLLDKRTGSWIQHKYDIAGNLYWDAAAYTKEDLSNEYTNIYEDPYRFTHDEAVAGDGFLAYPGAAYGVYGALPSIRLMSIRDGLEEYEILNDVEEKAQDYAGTFGSASIASTVLDYYYEAVSHDGTKLYEDGTNGLNFTEVRSNLLKLAVSLDDNLGVVMGDINVTDNLLMQDTVKFTYYVQAGATVTIGGSTQTPSSGQKYEKQMNLDGKTYVTISVTRNGQKVDYTYYLGSETTLWSGRTSSDNTVTTQTSTNEAVGSKAVAYNAEENSELLFSFESYKDITGAGLRMSGTFGKTKVNTKASYVKEGNASWLLMPQGDYGNAQSYPWFAFNCMDTTIAKNDFSAYEKLLMDVYNDSDKEITMQWQLSILGKDGQYVGAETVSCVLQPRAWTTCEYDLTNAIYDSYFDLSAVKYLKVTILDKKTSKNDTVSEIYLDNLRGVLSDTEREPEDMTYTLGEGGVLTFETFTDIYQLQTSTNEYHMDLSQVAYADTAITDVDASLGDYALMGVTYGGKRPALTVNFGKKLGANYKLSYMLYVEVDENQLEEGDRYGVQAYKQYAGGAPYLVKNANGNRFNEWVQIEVYPTIESTSLWTFVNLTDASGLSMFDASVPVKIYVDNIQMVELSESEKYVTESSGVMTMHNHLGVTDMYYAIDQPVKAGQHLSFNIRVTPGQDFAVWVLGEGDWMTEYFSSWFAPTDGAYRINANFPADASTVTIVVRLTRANCTEAKAKIKIVEVADGYIDPSEGGEIEDDDLKDEVVIIPDVTITDSDVNGEEVYVINEALPAGTKVTVDIVSATSDKDMAMWLIGSNNVEYAVWGWGNFQTQPTFVANITSDIEYLKVIVRGIDGNSVGFNYTIEKPEVPDVTITDSDVNGEEWYIFDEELPAGTKVTVEIVSATSNKDMAVWLIGSNWAEYAVWGWGNLNTQPVLSITVPVDLAHLKVKVGGIDGNSVSFNYTIEKPAVVEPIVLSAADSASVTINEVVPAGSTITVKVISATDDNAAIWIYSPSTELAVWGWGNPQTCPTITATVTKDLPWFRVQAGGLDGRSISFVYEITIP